MGKINNYSGDQSGDIATRFQNRLAAYEAAKQSFEELRKSATKKQIETNSQKASDMAASMNVGSEAIDSTVDSMAMGAKYLDDIWKGETKETFMEELTELHSLIKENSDTLKELGAKIEEENKITDAQQKKSYEDASNIYFQG